ncbi:bifunctional 4-hydroxy-2-oxoglutarate aldolase/2-dehydro-3-deoxy-phosphogluconate aldolase [Virgibacillus sp. NKC19-3]|uniref:bifunctional 4-hydroxy-2-oxoglutarate aldolase/2-dehydro-3-deoxy-phosphogluconate aldolase n=1 Tax=Virgibacillus saliphilus TaxID=2831674 RepID=UPI001C9A9FD4|nr:bifunctional 4-hydroxy-2-oxoglutarate aldolase/2-dehydro-3-deoxy-phosphogluconate aldolase [Virgibacillus sp. NKC19-3]MBY7141765.1 bifunctional 4-hydroxy-2-oxoglutarate aldolase/2-dehydro-3-deoxy-phosphogluconate aldolase [Virgibacillus sp. NKC19-3]
MNTLQSIYDNKIIAVIRNAKEDDILNIAEALFDGGVNILEITAETPNFLDLISQVSNTFGEKVIVGGGTILDPETARVAILHGAKFVFSPTVNTETIQMANRYGAISIPGAMTPTEILTAYENGADIIKVFPASILGPKYLKDVHAPLPHIPLMPTGGISIENVKDYFKYGASAVGIGSALVDTNKPMNKEELGNIKERASLFKEAIT